MTNMATYMNKTIIGKDGITRRLINVTALSLEYEWHVPYKKMFDEVSTILRLFETEAYFTDGIEVK